MRFEHLFKPIAIGKMNVPNRTVMPAMGSAYATPDNKAGEQLVAYLERRAQGGTGLIIAEICAIDPRGKALPNELGGWSDDFIPSLARIPEAVHRHGAKAAIQLHHAGRETLPNIIGGAVPEAPSAIPSVIYRQPCEAMNLERIAEIIQAYAAAAGRAQTAGFDAVEIHGAHGYLISQFLSPFTNHREDKYGGDDAGRSRLLLDVIAAVRKQTGPDFPIIVRVSADEIIADGYHLEFMQALAPKMVTAGANAIHASLGAYSTPGFLNVASMDTETGFNLFRARAIKETVDVPVIGVGRISNPDIAEEALARGDADLIAFGRPLLADPDFVKKAREGRPADIRPCIACNQGCIERLLLEMGAMTCSFNPECGQEFRGAPEPAAKSKHVWVVGAGPAGLQAALIAAGRGHQVEVFEQNATPGGQLLPASAPPHKEVLKDWLAWIQAQLAASGVMIHLGKKISREDLEAKRPDAVILATGADPCTPDIAGLDSPQVVDARALLMGKSVSVGPAVILGGGHVGMETADFLINQGIAVTILEQLAKQPVTTQTVRGYWLYKRLRRSRNRLITGARVMKVTPDGVHYIHEEQELYLPAKLVVTALGARPNDALKTALEELDIFCIPVGDVNKPRRFLEAVHEGHQAGLAL
ncbi:MAG: FAD-dependent oxidoreductase [Syntrophaceae bacterium]|nr:FAD-dependent oxidoreductase [Syntrophaceae bacterium]